ncbi:DUF6220 domain-containing protein [Virgibacillus flavescens]|uniref:DUF6220 domain-containing protein n=1 Tax=Virgibacillus flavescens TaxID=1611422 RepID=UPI003D3556D3
MAIFIDSSKWSLHTSFVTYIEFIPVIMLILASAGNLPKSLRWQCVGLYLMIAIQYVTVELTSAFPYLAAMHPLVAMILFWRSLVMARLSIHMFRI